MVSGISIVSNCKPLTLILLFLYPVTSPQKSNLLLLTIDILSPLFTLTVPEVHVPTSSPLFTVGCVSDRVIICVLLLLSSSILV